MKPQITATVTAAAIALAGVSAAPANALTDQERFFLLLTGAVTYAILSSHSTPTPTPPVPVVPHTYSTGGLAIPQSFSADLDHGVLNSSSGDLWFRAVSPTRRYLQPINGARISVGSGLSRGYAGCSVAHYSSHRVRLSHVPVGTYVCVKTNRGRISQFRMNAISGGIFKTLHIGYTTWR